MQRRKFIAAFGAGVAAVLLARLLGVGPHAGTSLAASGGL
jgi:hypothetical protein